MTPDHNAHSVYRALKRGEGHASPDTAGQTGTAGPRGVDNMADDAVYRAAFLRMHPTGKVRAQPERGVPGTEAKLAQIAADELGIPPEDVKVVHEDTDRFGEGNSFNSARATRSARTSP